ncbi:hypothetical protein Pmar_PMAR004552 [Perkinsus marinus ATCC 50983]|uniref:Integrase zinc-binding domain-containing protein n=1 Tax=Perkinsus marinus (strain ATCC 50983 / TXsc) TaxID=423536 RepID=C5LZZ3_PERM5|nr:hypothetical protein Pmar_PMAR004552 [Perkinsus marinus ATCC 50983]EEQ97811.1 hypothetical protein Pmar_PMAR004552 [Perkinsus marinus ATCC 50983]|eukprot:XP_002765094.1 hypothetical protein Pmar_PMAR004552 [Perkinsus marinus ATCC 50983]
MKSLQSYQTLAALSKPEQRRALVPPAFLLDCRLQKAGGEWMECSALLDTGSGLDFIVLYDPESNLHYQSEGVCNVRVRLAGGSVCAVTRWIVCTMQMWQNREWSTEFHRRFYVLPAFRKTPSCALAESVFLIAGRTFLRDFQVTVLGGEGQVQLRGLPVESTYCTSLCLVSGAVVDQVGWDQNLCASSEDAYTLSPDRLILDTPPVDQDVIYIPDSARRFAKAAYDRLSPDQQRAFDDIVDDYERRGWWVRRTEEEIRSMTDAALDPAVVFMVPGGDKRRDRLVVDLRRANKRFEKGSGSSTTVSLCIAAARLSGSGVCWVFDAAKAFYKLRWVGLMAILMVKEFLYTSRRCIFGVTTGPGSLRHTMGALVDDFRTMVNIAMLILCFADDVFCGGIQGAIAVCCLIWVLTVCGFAITTKKFQCMALLECRERVKEELVSHGLPADIFRWSDTVDLLGATLRFDQSGTLLLASCNRQERLKAAHTQAARLLAALQDPAKAGVSKALIFSLGGNLSYDCVGCHAIDRIVADSMRSWFASVYASEEWTVPCDLSRLDEVGRATAFALAEWATELTASPQECHHATPVRGAGDPIRIEVASDAATTGAGYVIHILKKVPGSEHSQRYLIGSGAWRFTAQQRHYHSNRRELAACCKALQAAVDILSHFAASMAGPLPPLEFTVCSDNKPTVAWLQGRGSISRSSLERRAVVRTLNAMKDEIDHLKALTRGAVVVKHIAGQENVLPDELSRLFDRFITLPSGRRISLADGLHGDLDDIAGCPDVFDEPGSETLGANWLLSSEMEGYFAQSTWEEGQENDDVVSIFAAMPTNDCLLNSYLVDDPEDVDAEPILQTLCAGNWDLGGVSADFLFLRRIFNALKPAARQEKLEELEEKNEECLIRSLQDDMDEPPLRSSGPYLREADSGIYVFRNGTADGGYVLLPVVPRKGAKCQAFRTKLLFDAHRASKHSTVASTVSNVYDKFFVPNLRAEARRFVKSCFACQLLRARRTWNQVPGGGPNRDQALSWEPYREVFIDILALGDIRGYKGTTKVLTVYCLHTFHSTWVPTGESMRDIVSALTRVQTEQGGLSLMWCDQASYFRTAKFSEGVHRTLGGRTELLPVRSPWKSGGGERMHGLGLRIAKMLLRGQAGYVGRKRVRQAHVDLEDICREVTFLLNTRPLDFSNSDEPSGECVVVTPDLLAKGFTRKRGCLLPAASSSFPITRRLKAARQYFLTNVFRDMRLAVAKSMGYASSRGKVLKIEQDAPVLIYHPEKKLSPGFRLAHVVSVLKEGRLIRVRFVDGSESEQHHYNVVPLLHNHTLSQQRGRILD